MKAPYQVPVGRAPLGGSGGIPPQKLFENWVLKGAIWCSLGGSEASKLYFICTTLFTVIYNNMTKPASLLTHNSSFVAVRSFALWKSRKLSVISVQLFAFSSLPFTFKSVLSCELLYCFKCDILQIQVNHFPIASQTLTWKWHFFSRYSDKGDEYFRFCNWRKIRMTFVFLRILEKWIR